MSDWDELFEGFDFLLPAQPAIIEEIPDAYQNDRLTDNPRSPRLNDNRSRIQLALYGANCSCGCECFQLSSANKFTRTIWFP